MLDIDSLLRAPIVLATNGKPIKEELPKVLDESYVVFRRKIGNKLNTRISYLEWIVHKLGYRLRLEIIDKDGMVVSVTMSDPKRPLLTEEDKTADKVKYTKHVDSSKMIAGRKEQSKEIAKKQQESMRKKRAAKIAKLKAMSEDE